MNRLNSLIIFFSLFLGSALSSFAQSAEERLATGMKLAKEGAYDQAFVHFLIAADSGNIEAMYHLGHAYEKGVGADSIPQKAIYWYQRAADSGYKKAYLPLGVLYYYQKQIPEAEQYLLQAAKFDKASYGIIGFIYYEEEKYSNAYKWLNRAVKVGDADAMFFLGEMFLDGNGVEYDEERAVQLFVRAARNGNEQAKEMLEDLGYEYRTPSERKSERKESKENEEEMYSEDEDVNDEGLGDLDFNDEPKQQNKKAKKDRKSRKQEKATEASSIDEGDDPINKESEEE